MVKTKFRKAITVMMATIMSLTTILSIGATPAFAATGEREQVYIVEYPRGGDTNNNGGWGHKELQYMNGWKVSSSSSMPLRTMGSYSGNIVYCIEPGTGQYTGDTLTEKDENYFNNISANGTISGDNIRLLIGRILQYGYRGGISTGWVSQNANDADKMAHAYATQLLIWETIVGERNADFSHKSTGSYNAILDCVKTNNPIRSKILSHYNDIVSSVQKHTKVPSFCTKLSGSAKVKELEWNGSKYATTLTDSNGVLSNYKFTASIDGVSFSVSGNKLTISMNKAPSKEFTITATKKNANRMGVVVWTDGKFSPGNGIQDVVSYAQEVSDPVSGYVKMKVSYGSCQIVKTSEDGKVDGIKFTISGNGIEKTVTTANGGKFQLDNLMPGVYTVTEQSIDKYIPQEAHKVTVVAGQVAKVNFNNVLKRGNLQVIKSSEDNLVEGVTFHLYGKSLAGIAVDEYAVTDKNGVATFSNVMISGTTPYTIEEVGTAIRYVVPAKQTAPIKWNEVTKRDFTNILKKFSVTVTKSDKEEGTAQGNATLAGAVYGIYKGETLVDKYVTDNNGRFTTKEYVCDTDWTIREIQASEGYLLDKTIHKVGADAKLYTVEHNQTANDVVEQVMKGNIAIIKHTDNGDTQIETPEKGAQFQIYLKSAGSFANAKATEKDTIVCDEDGFASCKLLPYGVYTVHQTKGWDGREKIKDFDVFINKDGKTYKFLINNANFMSYLKVVKLDKETNKPIAYEGAAFEIYDADGHRVTMQFTYPQVTSIHTFYTNSEGYLITPEKLPYGDYTLVEVQAPYGYVLDSTPVPFTIDQDNSSTDTGVTVVKVKANDIAQKGVINVTKTGEAFVSVTESNEMFTPVYDDVNLSNAVFEIFAAEDIVTLDGTVRYEQGEKVDEITTNDNGIATSKELYLGKYTVVEKTAPNGYVNSSEQYDIELIYAGQDVSVTKSNLSVYNERQKVEVSLAKEMEKDEIFSIGDKGEILSVKFGLYADEEIKAIDGKMIPKDSLITLANCDKDGKITFDCDLPVGFKWYVKEVATDEQYILDNRKYEFNTDYQGQDVKVIEIDINDKETIVNKIIYGVVKAIKTDRESKEFIKGALFGLFKPTEKLFTQDNAIMTTSSDDNGFFEFKNIPFGKWLVKEIKPAEGYLDNEEIYVVDINENEQVIEFDVVNDKVPEIKTFAQVDCSKTAYATQMITIFDTVIYKHLVPNKEYVLKGILMDKSTGKPLVINGKEIANEVSFVPSSSSGEINIPFTFDARLLKKDTQIVVFERLYKNSLELVAHADIDDEAQTVTVKIPEIKTSATIDGKKSVTASKKVTLVDTVSYTNLTVGKEYELKGVLMNKATGKPYMVDGKEVISVVKFTPTENNGTVDVKFTFDGSGINKTTELVVFETLYRDGVELTSHADINDKGQTVTIEAPKPKTPKTGDNSNMALWSALAGLSALGIVGTAVIAFRKKKKEDNE